MADFRKIIYALAMGTLLAGLSAPAFAQQLRCDASGVTPPFIRSEGRTELVGEVLILCTGGVSTAPGNPVPRVNITIRLTTNITSKLLETVNNITYNEALLIIDEPNSGRYAPNNMLLGQTGERPILACGDVGAPDTSPSGPNVCEIIAPNHPSRTYDGTRNGWGTSTDGTAINTCDGTDSPPAETFGCGRPNVFQGHVVPGTANMVEWNGVPFDPPGAAQFNSGSTTLATPWVRTLRFVNLRTDANSFFLVPGNNSAIPILADITFSGNTQAVVDNPRGIVVAYATSGITGPTVSGTTSFVQCVVSVLPNLINIADAAETLAFGAAAVRPNMFIRFGEGFAYSWKTKGWEQMEANSILVAGNRRYQPLSFDSPSTVIRQNVPGAIYHTESGFTAPPDGEDPDGRNPPLGIGTQPVTPLLTDQIISNRTGIEDAGIATNGTRLQIVFSNVPTGVTVYTPEVVYLTNAGSNVVTGIAIRNTTTNPETGIPFAPPDDPLPTQWLAVGSTNKAVYEIMYADPFARENLTVPIGITTVLNQLPQTIDVSPTVRGGFAPAFPPATGTSDPAMAQFVGSPAGNIPRFNQETLPGGQTLFSLVKCNCNLLFPFVSNASGFDTGIAIANTSLSPTDATYTQTLAQSGPVQFWYFQNGALARTECTNAASKGTCPGTTFVPSGGVMTFTLFGGSNTWGLNGAPSGFTGYMIAKTGFQYCHGFAYFSDLNRAIVPGIHGTSVGYLALVMDPTSYTGSISGSNLTIRNATPRTVNTTSDGLDQ